MHRHFARLTDLLTAETAITHGHENPTDDSASPRRFAFSAGQVRPGAATRTMLAPPAVIPPDLVPVDRS